jgi:multisubunit Na+/H+ antiporter MnhB subunit
MVSSSVSTLIIIKCFHFDTLGLVFWGTAIVLFLVKWINLHNAISQGFWLELSQQIETGLFTLTSVGLIPWRVVDTYRTYPVQMVVSLSHTSP